ncbi:MAG: hypothetical protein DRO65_01715 [Candidatus Altiarchaeales archaeon]|nr:MAG: hypothetical protein DRO65_01715 [Candidatus Altiarchaeales archaeon]
MLPISACLIIRNEEKYIKRCLQSLPDVKEILIIDQNSTDNTLKEIRSLKKDNIKIFQRANIGNADPMRNFLYSLASQPWILALDADEYLSKKTKSVIPYLIDLKPSYDVFWFFFENLVEGKNIREILGDDPHPRLFRKGALVWPTTLHTYPEIKSPFQFWVDRQYKIIHDRTLEDIRKSHKSRTKLLDPRARQQELVFLKKLMAFLGVEDNLEWF